jgi:hypothetical protein
LPDLRFADHLHLPYPIVLLEFLPLRDIDGRRQLLYETNQLKYYMPELPEGNRKNRRGMPQGGGQRPVAGFQRLGTGGPTRRPAKLMADG